jgi:hypothetical protein
MSNKKVNKPKVLISGVCDTGKVTNDLGFIGDASAGFSVAALLMKKAILCDTKIQNVISDIAAGDITVETRGGGTATVNVKSGITPSEAELMHSSIGKDAVYPQRTVFETFGRIYREGTEEVPGAFEGAMALAVIDTFRHVSKNTLTMSRLIPGSISRTMLMIFPLNGVMSAVMLSVDGYDVDVVTENNLGRLPHIIVNGKFYNPEIADRINETAYAIRCQKERDSEAAAGAVLKALKDEHIPGIFIRTKVPGRAAVLGVGVSKRHKDYFKIPLLLEEEAYNMVNIILSAVKHI